MRILFLGDIVGRPGRTAVIEAAASIREELRLDFLVANAENAAGGAGITAALARELHVAGVDLVTLGDHVWDHAGFERDIASLPFVTRPANLPASQPGRTLAVALSRDGRSRLAVASVLGRTFMGTRADCPFAEFDRLAARAATEADALLVDVHAEATSEKISLGWHADGRAAVVVGTHTHVATADVAILPAGTAYQTDAGMCGPHAGVLGRETAPCVARFIDGMPRRCPVAEGDVRLNGLLVDYDPATRRSLAAERWSRG